MAKSVNRAAKADVIVAIVLMISIVLFVGSLYWLTLYGPWNGPQEENMIMISYNKTETVNPTDYEPDSIEEALLELSEANYTIISYDIEIGERSIHYLRFEEFKEKALKNNVVIFFQLNQIEKALLVNDQGRLWLWKP